MGNPPRYIPPGSLVEVTTRTIHGRFLLRPSRRLNETVVGVLARAAKRYQVGVVDFKVLSNHVHLLLAVDDAEQLASFMAYVNGNIAKEAGRLHGWNERFWGRRYRAILVSDEPEAQVARLRYMLSQGCKEGLVRSPRRWPGASGTEALLTGQPARGWWFDRTAEFYARRRGESFDRYTHALEEELVLEPLPCWRHLGSGERRRRVVELVREIEAATRERLEREGKSVMGARRLRRQHPHDTPERTSSSPAPRFHAATAAAWCQLEKRYREFLEWYREASRQLLAGKLNAEFPPGCFRPRPPFARGRPLPMVG